MAEAGCLQIPCTSPHEGQLCPHKRPQGQWRGGLGGPGRGELSPPSSPAEKSQRTTSPGQCYQSIPQEHTEHPLEVELCLPLGVE